VNHYHQEYCQRYKKGIEISPSLINHLMSYSWPGNVRELQHAVERAVILCRGPVITQDDFQLAPISSHGTPQFHTLNLSEMEKELVRRAIEQHNGNLTRVAEELGIGRTTLYRKLEEYGLRDKEL
jgi:DNA-binding NtrC family response regulator